ncbi:unnamed protein product [Moneuplotes crassus]|uniref:Uncharacterized protein n=2 Tax=Euplotes crassus TaxID=5936 RepID=A0AAD1U2M2_EUPCR|nr:unnamed protein product [Moneuplotes crassus]
MFIYDELVKHEDMEMSGNIPEEEEVNDEEQEEHFEIGSEYTKKERKNLRLLRCCICDDFVKEPFFLCIKSACLGKRNLYCYECYVDKWCKHNNKPIGACRNGCEFDPSSSDLEMRKPPVQRFDQHSKEISKDAKRRIKEILNKGINMNYDLIYLLQQYLGYQKEDEKEELKEEVKEEPIEEPIEETKETSDEKDSKESQEEPQKEPQEEPQKEPQEEPQKEPQEEPQEGTNNNSNIKHPEDPERQKRWERFLHAFKVFTSSNIFIRIYNQNHIQDLRKFISKENLEIIDEKIKQIEPLEKELRELKEAQKNHIYNNQIQSKSNQESLEEVKEVATSDDRSNRSAARSIPSSKSTNIASKLTSDPNAFSDGKSAIKGIAKFVTSIKNNFLMITFRRREQEKLQLLHSKEHTLQDCKKYSRFSIECFRLIDIESLDRSKLIKFCKILEDIGTTLNFLVFSQFRFRHLNQISDSTLKYKEMKRGRYDVDISIECANSLMFIEKREKDDHFRAIKINPDDEDKATPSDHFYANLDSEGIQAIRPDKLPDPNDDDHKAQFAFKVIRTPVRGKTYIIGGKTNKSIRHMTTGESGRPIIKQVYCKYTVDAVKEFDLFDKTSTLFR